MIYHVPELNRIDLDIHGRQTVFSFRRNIHRIQDALVRGSGCIISFDGLIVHMFF